MWGTRRWVGRLLWLFILMGPQWVVAGDAGGEVVASSNVETTELDWDHLSREAGKNIDELRKAWEMVPADRRPGLQFLLANMPPRDMSTLTASFLLDHLEFAYLARQTAPWELPEDVFLNYVLPYANINEGRELWRRELRERFYPLVKEITSPAKGAALLNQKVFSELNVKYSTKRRRADQAPSESIKSGLASCTGLSILLIDACRAVGIPARFVGTPLWSDQSGNHSWVEIWDQGWHFTGAAEPTGDELNRAWFVDRASQSRRDDPAHAIYAVSFKKTPLPFPLVWDRSIDYVSAVNVTDRYAQKTPELPADQIYAMFRVQGIQTSDRCAVAIEIQDEQGKPIFQGTTKDERFDANDHTTVPLVANRSYQVKIGSQVLQTIQVSPDRKQQLFSFEIDSQSVVSEQGRVDPLLELRQVLDRDEAQRGDWRKQAFATVSLTKGQAEQVTEWMLADRRGQIQTERGSEVDERKLKWNDLAMPYYLQVFGDKPDQGRSLVISLHGGGNAPPQVNDRQWQNQQKLYSLSEGVYVAPRAPSNTWDLWHQAHVDRFFQRLIEDMIVFEEVNPNRVYLMGYSAGGDGVFQLAPRMADRFAAAAMMAGHPNETKPLGLRNLGFALYMGGKDNAYRRNEVAAEWKVALAALRQHDPSGYAHQVTIYPDKGHWMDHEDASAIPWMAEFTRQPWPDRVAWRQDDVLHDRFYWLSLPASDVQGGSDLTGAEVVAQRQGQTIEIVQRDSRVKRLVIRCADALVDLDQTVVVRDKERVWYEGKPPRTIEHIAASLDERFDPMQVFTSSIEIDFSP